MTVRLTHVTIRNYRRLVNCTVALEQETTIFVGANNSGKTSAVHALQAFLDTERPRLSVYDFNVNSWTEFDLLGRQALELNSEKWPSVSLDLWFDVDDRNLHRAIPLIPTLDWKGGPLGARITYGLKDVAQLLTAFQQAGGPVDVDQGTTDPSISSRVTTPWPLSMTDFLRRRMSDHYSVKYEVLTALSLDDIHSPSVVRPLGEKPESGRRFVRSLLRVDVLSAQRHLTDDGRGRAEDLSRRLNRFYQRNLKKHEDPLAESTLAESELKLNDHLQMVFGPTMERLSKLGYPGMAEPRLVVRSMNTEHLLSQTATVHYEVARTTAPGQAVATMSAPPTRLLPERYNGLGFKNLIYMVIEILDFHEDWVATAEDRPPVHLICIEEPEVHLHAQLQQVFIREVFRVLPSDEVDFSTQLIVTSHSSHIVYESNFSPIRYFRRERTEHTVGTSVADLSQLLPDDKETRDFLIRYMRLTHCDLLFADAAILVEGNVERILLPLMISKTTPLLDACYLTILEVGGAFAYRFKPLLEFLGLPSLVITDLDSVTGPGGTACPGNASNAVTSNETLRSWIPGLEQVEDLLAATEQQRMSSGPAAVFVAYQGEVTASVASATQQVVPRTFEESFGVENLEWIIQPEQTDLKLLGASPLPTPITVESLSMRIYEVVRSKSFTKTEFALTILLKDDSAWTTPAYIRTGLEWLASRLEATHGQAAETEAGEMEVILALDAAETLPSATVASPSVESSATAPPGAAAAPLTAVDNPASPPSATAGDLTALEDGLTLFSLPVDEGPQ